MPSTEPRRLVLFAGIAALVLAAALLARPVTGETAPVSAAAAPKPTNPCLDALRRARLYCPDLVMKRPADLYLDRTTKPGRVLLRAANSIDNVGLGPAQLYGKRDGRYTMDASQRIQRRRGGLASYRTGAQLFFKYVRGQVRYWKFRHAAGFALLRLDRQGRAGRVVRRGPKVSYCLRDLEHSRPGRTRSPKTFHFPACSTNPAQRSVTLGTSVGWSDVYPSTYPEQWIDVTGLRGCFLYRHTADPANGIFESNERNNVAGVVVRLPFRDGRQRCAGGGVAGRGGGDGAVY